MVKEMCLALVVRDVRDATRDYYMSAAVARRWFEQGKLVQVQAYNGAWIYAHKS